MADPNRADRHTTDRHPVSVPARLWQRFGRVVGERKRSEVIRDLIQRYLEGKPMPPLPDDAEGKR